MVVGKYCWKFLKVFFLLFFIADIVIIKEWVIVFIGFWFNFKVVKILEVVFIFFVKVVWVVKILVWGLNVCFVLNFSNLVLFLVIFCIFVVFVVIRVW